MSNPTHPYEEPTARRSLGGIGTEPEPAAGRDARHPTGPQAAASRPLVSTRDAKDSRVRLAHVMSHLETNLYGSVHGGAVMKLIDDAAAAAAGRHAGVPALTVSVESMSFLAPARSGDLLTVRAQLVSVGRTSMKIEALVTAERWNDLGPVERIAQATLVFVAVDANGNSHPVPALEPAEDDWLVGESIESAKVAFIPNEEGQRPRRAL